MGVNIVSRLLDGISFGMMLDVDQLDHLFVNYQQVYSNSLSYNFQLSF